MRRAMNPADTPPERVQAHVGNADTAYYQSDEQVVAAQYLPERYALQPEADEDNQPRDGSQVTGSSGVQAGTVIQYPEIVSQCRAFSDGSVVEHE